MRSTRTILIAALVALSQIGFLGWSIMSRAAVLRDGKEILLKVEPVDPRDLLRGDYVRLGYEASRIPTSLLAGDKPLDATSRTFWVRLQKQPDGYWTPIAARRDAPPSEAATAEQVDVRARYPDWMAEPESAGPEVRVDYGIERYYVPEGEGLEIEQGIGVRPFGILAAVAPDGTIQIKALMDGDRKLYEEPPY